jgi:hypothetical protein
MKKLVPYDYDLIGNLFEEYLKELEEKLSIDIENNKNKRKDLFDYINQFYENKSIQIEEIID